MDQDAGVQLVDMNPDDIEILQILASGPLTMIHTYTPYDINGYTFYTRALDNKKTNQTAVFKLKPMTVMSTGKPTMCS
jgi:hypothetical protein